MAKKLEANLTMYEPTDFGDREFRAGLVNVTNVCNLSCSHCFVFRADNPNKPKDRMDDQTMLYQLEKLRDKHGLKSMLFMGGEPMIRKDLVLEGMKLFESSSIVTNGTYGIPSVPGHLVTVSLDGPKELNDSIRGEGVFDKVKESVFAHDPKDGTILMLQMTVTAKNHEGIEEYIEEVKDWPVTGAAFTFYVPVKGDDTGLGWHDLKDRDPIIDRVIAVKKKHPNVVKANIGALEMMKSHRAIEFTGENGEPCHMTKMLPLYMGEGGHFEKPFCCYGNDVDCSRCGAYGVFNTAYHILQGTPLNADGS
jgi:MoaA/NifB/PqqE/SkfB family radical SAM enzyme